MGVKPTQLIALTIAMALTAGCAVSHSFSLAPAGCGKMSQTQGEESGDAPKAKPACGLYDRVETIGAEMPDGSRVNRLHVEGDLSFGAYDKALKDQPAPLMAVPADPNWMMSRGAPRRTYSYQR